MTKIFYSAQDVADLIGVSVSKAYQIIAQMNSELKEKGYLINYSDKEESEKSLDEVTATFRAAVAQGVKDALKGNAPRVSTGGRVTESDLIRSAFARNAR